MLGMAWIKCTEEAYKKCPFSKSCGDAENAFFMDGSDCDKFNQSIKQTTVDAVPVVRCRECRYYAASGATTSFCIHPGGMKFTSDSDYCSRGKRRDQSADVRNMGQFASPGKTGGQNDADQH